MRNYATAEKRYFLLLCNYATGEKRYFGQLRNYTTGEKRYFGHLRKPTFTKNRHFGRKPKPQLPHLDIFLPFVKPYIYIRCVSGGLKIDVYLGLESCNLVWR